MTRCIHSARLEANGLLKTVITQNIDGLHQKAGSQRVYEVHGHIREATCIRCYQIVPADSVIKEFLNDGQVPRCECGGVMKPNVILFGEQLPFSELHASHQETRNCTSECDHGVISHQTILRAATVTT